MNFIFGLLAMAVLAPPCSASWLSAVALTADPRSLYVIPEMLEKASDLAPLLALSPSANASSSLPIALAVGARAITQDAEDDATLYVAMPFCIVTLFLFEERGLSAPARLQPVAGDCAHAGRRDGTPHFARFRDLRALSVARHREGLGVYFAAVDGNALLLYGTPWDVGAVDLPPSSNASFSILDVSLRVFRRPSTGRFTAHLFFIVLTDGDREAVLLECSTGGCARSGRGDGEGQPKWVRLGGFAPEQRPLWTGVFLHGRHNAFLSSVSSQVDGDETLYNGPSVLVLLTQTNATTLVLTLWSETAPFASAPWVSTTLATTSPLLRTDQLNLQVLLPGPHDGDGGLLPVLALLIIDRGSESVLRLTLPATAYMRLAGADAEDVINGTTPSACDPGAVASCLPGEIWVEASAECMPAPAGGYVTLLLLEQPALRPAFRSAIAPYAVGCL